MKTTVPFESTASSLVSSQRSTLSRAQAAAVESVGFRPRRGQRGWWTLARERRLFVLGPDRVLRVRANAAEHALELSTHGRAGLWRLLRTGRALAWEFELDPAVLGFLGVAANAECEGAPEAALLGWALATRDGFPPDGWHGPEEALVRSWTSKCARDVRVGALVASVAIVRGEARLALEIGLGTLPAGGLPPARAAWLAAVLADANERTRLVRFGFAAHDGRPLAEVDLSGAPIAHLPALVERACDALAVAVRPVLPAVDLITNPSVACATLEQLPSFPTRVRP